MLRVTLLGNLGADPEMRFTNTGQKVATFRVAVNSVRKGPDGTRQENTEWFRVTTIRQANFAETIRRGHRVLVVGRLEVSHYNNKDGEPRVGFDVWADDLQSMTPRQPLEADTAAEEAEPREPALAGVSSVQRPPAVAAVANGNNGKASAAPPVAAAAEDLEDLPF